MTDSDPDRDPAARTDLAGLQFQDAAIAYVNALRDEVKRFRQFATWASDLIRSTDDRCRVLEKRVKHLEDEKQQQLHKSNNRIDTIIHVHPAGPHGERIELEQVTPGTTLVGEGKQGSATRNAKKLATPVKLEPHLGAGADEDLTPVASGAAAAAAAAAASTTNADHKHESLRINDADTDNDTGIDSKKAAYLLLYDTDDGKPADDELQGIDLVNGPESEPAVAESSRLKRRSRKSRRRSSTSASASASASASIGGGESRNTGSTRSVANADDRRSRGSDDLAPGGDDCEVLVVASDDEAGAAKRRKRDMVSTIHSPLQPSPRVRARPQSDDEDGDDMDAWTNRAADHVHKCISDRLLGNAFAAMGKENVMPDTNNEDNDADSSGDDLPAAVPTRGTRRQTPLYATPYKRRDFDDDSDQDGVADLENDDDDSVAAAAADKRIHMRAHSGPLFDGLSPPLSAPSSPRPRVGGTTTSFAGPSVRAALQRTPIASRRPGLGGRRSLGERPTRSNPLSNFESKPARCISPTAFSPTPRPRWEPKGEAVAVAKPTTIQTKLSTTRKPATPAKTCDSDRIQQQLEPGQERAPSRRASSTGGGGRPSNGPSAFEGFRTAGEAVRLAEQLIRGPAANAAALPTNTRKETRRKMFARTCPECERFINQEAAAQGMDEDRRQQLLQQCSRHRCHRPTAQAQGEEGQKEQGEQRQRPPPETPEDYWKLTFDDTTQPPPGWHSQQYRS